MRRAQNRIGEHYLSSSDNSFLDLFPVHGATEKAFAFIEAAAIRAAVGESWETRTPAMRLILSRRGNTTGPTLRIH